MANDVKLKLAVEGGQVVSQTIDGVTKRLEAMGGTAGIAKNMLAGMATGLSVAAFTAYARAAIDAADAMNDLSQRVGISVRELAKYELAAAQSGTTLEALAKGVKGIAVNLADYGDALKKAGITATTADGAMRQIADVFAAMPDGMEKTTLAVKLFGKSGMDMIPMLNLGSAGLQAAAEQSAAYAEQMALLAPLADAFNDNLATLATASKTVGMAMINPFMPALVAITGQMAEAATQTGVFEAAIVGVGGALRVGWGHEIEIMMLKTRAWLNELEAKKLRFFGRDDEAGAYMNAANNDYNAIKNLYANDPLKPKPAAPVDTSAIDGALEKYKALLAALKDNNSASSDAEKIAKARAAAEKKAIEEATKTAQGIANIRNKEAEDIDAYMRAESTRLADTARASEDAVRAAQDEYDNHGKLQSAIAETTLARLQDQLVNKTAGTEAYASIARQVEAQRQLINILKNGEARDAAEDAAKELADANKKAAEESGKYWEDALMRAFESGKGFFESLWSTIKNTLKTQVLKIIIAPIAGAISGVASAATGGVLGGAAAGSLLGGAAASAGTGTLTSLLGATGMGSLDIAGFAVGGPAGIAVAAAAAALYAIFGNKKTPSAGTGEGNMSFDASGNVTGSTSRYSGSWGLTTEVEKTLQSLSTSYLAAAQSLGIGAVAAEFGYGGNTGKEGKDPQFALGVNAGGVSYSSGEIQLNDANVQLAASRAVFAALQGSELPAYLVDLFNGVTAATATQDQISAVYDYAAQLKNVRYALAETREPLQILQDQVSAGTAALATSADTFTTDFIAAIDAGISPARLAQWQALGTALDQLAANAAETAQQVAAAAAALQADIYSAQDDAMSAYMSAQADYAAIVAQEQEAAAQSMQAAAVATADAAESIRSALASAGAGIAALIRDLTTTAGGTLDPMSLARSTQAAYLDDLRRAHGGDVDASGRVAGSARAYLDASGAVSTNSRQAATVAQVVRELSQLPAVKTYEQQLLEAIQGTTTAVTTSSASNASTIAAALSTKLIAELSVTAQSEILKLINFVAITDQLPDDLKALALADASTMSKTISFVQGSTLTPENKQLALLTETSVIKTYNFVAASELTADQKQQAFGVLMSGDRVIRVVTGSLLSDDAKQQAFGAITSATRAISIIADSTALAAYKQTALEAVASATKWVHLAATGFSSYDANLISSASSSVTKAVSLALQNSDPWALTVLAAQDRTVSTILNASGGVLTMEQRTLLDGITNYNKNIQIGIKIDSSELSTFQQTLMSIFGTIDITGLAAAGVDLSGVISNEALARLQSVSTYVQSFDWVNTDLSTRAAQMHAVRTTAIAYGVSSQDVATALGVTRDTLGSWYDYLNVPFFDRGANVIPQDTLAMVHQGERIVPAADNRELMARLQSPQANSDALVAEIRRLNATNEALERRLAAIERNTNATAVHTANTADSTRTMERDGLQVWTDPAEPINTVAAA